MYLSLYIYIYINYYTVFMYICSYFIPITNQTTTYEPAAWARFAVQHDHHQCCHQCQCKLLANGVGPVGKCWQQQFPNRHGGIWGRSCWAVAAILLEVSWWGYNDWNSLGMSGAHTSLYLGLSLAILGIRSQDGDGRWSQWTLCICLSVVFFWGADQNRAASVTPGFPVTVHHFPGIQWLACH